MDQFFLYSLHNGEWYYVPTERCTYMALFRIASDYSSQEPNVLFQIDRVDHTGAQHPVVQMENGIATNVQ